MRVDQLADILVSVGLVAEEAVYDQEGYDEGRSYDQICDLYDQLFPVEEQDPPYIPPEKCEGCEQVVRKRWVQETEWCGTLHRGECDCGRVVDQGSGWEEAAP